MDASINEIDDRVVTYDTTKAEQSDLLQSLKSVDYDTTTGIFIFTWWNGTTKSVDLNIEKIPVSFSMSAQGVITMTTADGTTFTADVSTLIKTYTFVDSSEIDFTVTTDANGNKTVTASIVAGSIDGTKLTPNYLADAQAARTGAETAATLSQSWAVGGTNTRTGEDTNNAKYWCNQAQLTTQAGHVIEDPSGTDMTQRKYLQFTGNVTVTDDAGNDKSIVNLPYTSAANSSYDNTTSGLSSSNVQDAIDEIDTTLDKTFILTNQTITFSNLAASISDARIAADTAASIWYDNTNKAIAVAAGVTAETVSGGINFAAVTAPSGSITIEKIVCVND